MPPVYTASLGRKNPNNLVNTHAEGIKVEYRVVLDQHDIFDVLVHRKIVTPKTFLPIGVEVSGLSVSWKIHFFRSKVHGLAEECLNRSEEKGVLVK